MTDLVIPAFPDRLAHLPEWLPDVLHRVLDYGAHFLIVECGPIQDPYYVQFLPIDGGSLYCEAASNEFLGGDDRLSRDDEMKLIHLGWASLIRTSR